MMKSLYEELGGTYILAENGMYYPNLTLGKSERRPIGRWGRMHRAWLEKEHPGLYEQMILNDTLDKHLADVEERTQKMIKQLSLQMARQEGITEHLKAVDQMEWVRRMNSIRCRVEEIVYTEVINAL